MKTLLLLFVLVPAFSFASVSVHSDTSAPRSSFTYTYHWWRGYRFFENGEKITYRAGRRLLWKDSGSRPYMKRQLMWTCILSGVSLTYFTGVIIARRNNWRPNLKTWQLAGISLAGTVFVYYFAFGGIIRNLKKAVRARAQ